MLCTCACPCCSCTLRIGKLIAYEDGSIEPLALDRALSLREHEALMAMLAAFPRPTHLGEVVYGSRSANDQHNGRVLAVRLRAKLEPWGVGLINYPGRGYTLSAITSA